jgi:hypothetical protein
LSMMVSPLLYRDPVGLMCALSGVAVATRQNINRQQASGSYLFPAGGDARAWCGPEWSHRRSDNTGP